MMEVVGAFMVGLFVGLIIGLGTHKSSVDDRCIAGWHWKDVDYAYTCTATKRP